MTCKRLFLGALLCVVFGIAILSFASHQLNVDLNEVFLHQIQPYVGSLSSYFSHRNEGKSVDKSKTRQTENVMISEELAKYTGEGSYPVYIAFLGKIYDVDSGRKHYGPGGGYSFFAGRDASRAFVTGDFTEKGLVDDVLGLSHADMLGIKNWIEFYEKEYKYVGKLIGRYYDKHGVAKKKLKHVWDLILSAEKWQQSNDDEAKKFPPCNSEWNAEIGGRVWCSTLSGGIERNWAGVPRKYHKPGSTDSRCACIRNFGPPSDWNSATDKPHTNQGDLLNPNLRAYKNCDPSSEACPLED